MDGKNVKFKHETLLNYAMNRWALNKAHSVGKTSELIRNCAPKSFEQWEEYYFETAYQNKKDGAKITREYIRDLGQKLYVKLSEVVQHELASITEDECIEYAYNLVLNRTYEGYKTEIETIYGQLEGILSLKIEPAPDEWDRTYGVDFFIEVSGAHIGIQIKPVDSGKSINDYQWATMHQNSHERFTTDHGGKVFFVYSEKASGKKKRISNTDVIEEIKQEIERLKKVDVYQT
ncbi:MAG: MjaI family restriction endonuclease [Desulfamplus sp.]|nr:MjaI family restriction endonuclease [Desulfamplus sp.]